MTTVSQTGACTSSLNGILATALEWRATGASIVPTRTDGSKSPAGAWKQYQTTAATSGQLHDWFTNGNHDGLGVITGAVSGNLEMLEVEGRGVHLAADIGEALADHGLGDVWAAINQGCAELTPNGGIHWHYRVDGPAKKNTKLASRPATADELEANPDEKIKVLIETRGEGGFTILAPSNGRTHPTGRAWTRAGGAPATIPTITVEQRDAIHTVLAAIFDETPPTPVYEPAGASTTVDGARPGDLYNAKADWADILEPAGWTRVGRPTGGNQAWARPGKTAGISATTRACDGGDWLYVFTTSTVFEAERAYSKFSAYCLLTHGGDYTAAARQLARDGYTDNERAQTIANELAGIIAPPAGQGVSGSGDIEDVDLTYQRGSLSAAVQADVVARALRGKFLWNKALGWLRWDGKRWAPCAEENVVEQIRRHQKLAVKKAVDKGTDDDMLKKMVSLLGDGNLRAVERLLRGVAGINVPDAATFDAHPDLLNAGNGVIDLTTGALRDHDPKLMLTKVTPVDYRPGATHPDWGTTLDAVPPTIQDYLRRRLGQGVTGHSPEDDVMPILHASGENGKTTLLSGVQGALGDDYCVTLSEKVILAKPGDHLTSLMRLRGARLAVSEELPEGAVLPTKRLKDLTGTATLSANHMHKDEIQFKVSHTLVLTTNYRPLVFATDRGTWRRLALVDFPYTFVKPGVPLDGTMQKHGDPTLRPRILRGEDGRAEAVLAWLVSGAVDWYAAGRISEPPPASVEKATEAWRKSADQLLGFADDCLVFEPKSCVMSTELLAALHEWQERHGYAPWNDRTFAERMSSSVAMQKHHVEKGRTRAWGSVSRRFEDMDGKSMGTAAVTIWKCLAFKRVTPDMNEQMFDPTGEQNWDETS